MTPRSPRFDIADEELTFDDPTPDDEWDADWPAPAEESWLEEDDAPEPAEAAAPAPAGEGRRTTPRTWWADHLTPRALWAGGAVAAVLIVLAVATLLRGSHDEPTTTARRAAPKTPATAVRAPVVTGDTPTHRARPHHRAPRPAPRRAAAPHRRRPVAVVRPRRPVATPPPQASPPAPPARPAPPRRPAPRATPVEFGFER